MSKYIDILKGGPAKIEADLIPFKVTQAQKTCELELSKSEESIASLEMKLAAAKSQHPLVLVDIVNASNALVIAKKNLATAKTIITELF